MNQQAIKLDPALSLIARNRHARPYSNFDGNRPNPNSDSAATSIPYTANASDLGTNFHGQINKKSRSLS